MPTLRCTGCNWDVPEGEIVWQERQGDGSWLRLCAECNEELEHEEFVVFKLE